MDKDSEVVDEKKSVEEAEPQDGSTSTPPVEEENAAEKQTERGDTVNRYKYNRDIKSRDAEIERLKKELEEAKGLANDASKLREEFESYKAEQQQATLDKQLSDAGCINLKAAKAVLDDFEGDIAKLKTSAPYLFVSTDNSQSTGGKPNGSSSSVDSSTARFRKAAGLAD